MRGMRKPNISSNALCVYTQSHALSSISVKQFQMNQTKFGYVVNLKVHNWFDFKSNTASAAADIRSKFGQIEK